MAKEKFYSELFGREIYKSEPEYKQKAVAEALYRVYRLEKENCSCMQCKTDLEHFRGFLEKQIKK